MADQRLDCFTDQRRRRPTSLLRSLSLLALFVTVWTVYGAISFAPASIHHDMAEAYVWGREFQLGYFAHPPFWAWIAGLWFEFFPRVDWAFYLLSMLNAGLGLLGSWFLIGNFASGDRRLAATALLLLTPFYTFLALKFNANSIFLSLWPWTTHFFIRSLNDRRLSHAILFGLFMGLALLSKYFALILATTCLLAALAHPQWRQYLRSASPYVSFAVAALVFAPHVAWLASNDAAPVQYFIHKTGYSLGTALLAVLGLMLAALAFHALILGLIGWTRKPRWSLSFLGTFLLPWGNPGFRVLFILAVLPLVLTALAGLLFRLEVSSNMTIGIFSLAPLLLLEVAGPGDDRRLYNITCWLALCVMGGALILSPIIALAKFRLGKDISYVEPRKELALEATGIWRSTTGFPLRYVGGREKYQAAVSFYSADRPHVLTDRNFQQSRWVSSDDLSRSGFLIVCAETDKTCMDYSAALSDPNKSVRRITLTHSFWNYAAPAVSLVLTLVPPSGSFAPPVIAESADQSCKAQAKDEKLAGTALASFMDKCEDDAKSACRTRAAAKNLSDDAKDTFIRKCLKDALGL